VSDGFHVTEEEFRAVVVEILRSKKLADEDIAHEFGVSLPAVRKWASGDGIPMCRVRALIVKVLRDKTRG